MQELEDLKKRPFQMALLVILFCGLIFVFMSQRVDWLHLICGCRTEGNFHFIFNKTVRLVLNDILMLAIIAVWFHNRTITRLALGVQFVDLFVLFPAYLFLKLTIEGDREISTPLLSYLHRLIVNPTLMLLLFPAIYLQRFVNQK